MFKKNKKLLSLTCATLLSTASFSISADDYPDRVNNIEMDTSISSIDLLRDAEKRTRTIQFYAPYSRECAQENSRSECIAYKKASGTIESENVSYTQYRGKIKGVLNEQGDVDIIPIKIPSNLYYSIGFDIQDSFGNDTFIARDIKVDILPKLSSMTYNPLFAGDGFFRINSTSENSTFGVPKTETNSFNVLGTDKVLSAIGEGLYDGEEYLLYVYSRGSSSTQFPVKYTISYDLTEVPAETSASKSYYWRSSDTFRSGSFSGYGNWNLGEQTELLNIIPIDQNSSDYIRCTRNVEDRKSIAIENVDFCYNQLNDMKNNRVSIINDNKNKYVNSVIRGYENTFNNSDASHQFNILSFEPLVTHNTGIFKEERYNKLRIYLRSNLIDDNPFEVQDHSVIVRNQRTGEEEQVNLTESVCPQNNEYWYDPDFNFSQTESSTCFFGEIEKIKSSSEKVENGVIGIIDGDILEYSSEYNYDNPYDSSLDQTFNATSKVTVLEFDQNGELTINKESILNGDVLSINLVDQDKNKNTSQIDEVTVEVRTQNGQDTETVSLLETDVNTGVFGNEIEVLKVNSSSGINSNNGVLEFSLSGNSTSLPAFIRYEDNNALYANEIKDLERYYRESGHVMGGLYNFSDENIASFSPLVIEKEFSILSPETSELSVSRNYVSINEEFNVRVSDCGISSIENPKIIIENNTTGQFFEYSAENSQYDDCEIRTGDIKVINQDQISNYDEGTYFVASEGDEVTVKWFDEYNENGAEESIEQKINIMSESGSFGDVSARVKGIQNFFSSNFNEVILTGGDQILELKVGDRDLNKKEALETIFIKVENLTKNIEREVYLNEVDCTINEESWCRDGVFTGDLKLTTDENSTDENEIYAEENDDVRILYVDEQTYGGTPADRELVFNVNLAQNSALNNDTFKIGESVFFGITDSDKSSWTDFLGYSDRENYEKIKVINKTKGYYFTLGTESLFYDPMNFDFNLIPYDVYDGEFEERFYSNGETIDVSVNVGDEIEFEFIDLFGEESNNQKIKFNRVVAENDYAEEASLFVTSLDTVSPFTITVYDASRNNDPNVEETLIVDYRLSDYPFGTEEESIILTELGNDSSKFVANIQPVFTNNASPDDNIVNFPEAAKNPFNDSYYPIFDYEKILSDGSTQGYQVFKQIKKPPYDIDISINPENPEVGGKMIVKIESESLDSFSLYPEIRVLDGERIVKEYFIEFENNGDNVFEKEFNLIDSQFEEGSYEYEMECSSGMAEVGSAGENDKTSATFENFPDDEIPFPEENDRNPLCLKEGYEIKVLLDEYNIERSYFINNTVPAPQMSVKNNILVVDEAWVEVVDEASNKDNTVIETTYASVSSINPKSFEFLEADLEEILLTETSADSGVFYGSISTVKRNEVGQGTSGNDEIETEITKFTDEYLRFGYYRERQEDFSYGENNRILDIKRDVLGGFSALLDGDEDVRINSSFLVIINDLDENKNTGGLNDEISFNVLNLRTNVEKVYTAGEINQEGVFVYRVPVFSDGDSSLYSLARPNDKLLVTYLDEEDLLLNSRELEKEVLVKPGNDALLEVKSPIYINEKIDVNVVDFDKNLDEDKKEEVLVTIENTRTNEIETLTLKEIEINSGEFSSFIETEFSETPISLVGVMGVAKDDVLKFTYTDEENSQGVPQELVTERIVFAGSNGNILSPSYVNITDNTPLEINVLVSDSDMNREYDLSETLQVRAVNERTGEEVLMILKENGFSSDFFEGKLQVNSDNENAISGEKDDRIRFYYNDELRADGSSSEIESTTDLLNSVAVGDTGVLEVTDPVYVVDSIMIKVTDADLNENSTEEESVSVVVSNSRTGERENVTLLENGTNSNEFIKTIEVKYSENPIDELEIFGVLKDDEMNFVYEDALNESGESSLVKENRNIIAGSTATLSVTDPVVLNQKVVVNVSDEDMNSDQNIKDEITVLIKNTTTTQSLNLILKETDINSGVFTSLLETEYSSDFLDSDRVLGIKKDDVINFEYVDSYNEKGEENISLREERVVVSGVDAVLEADSEQKIGTPINIRVEDSDENNTTNIDSVDVVVENTVTNEKEIVTLIETDNETGIFVSILTTQPIKNSVDNNGFLDVGDDDLIKVTYLDLLNSKGVSRTIEKELVFQGGFDGELIVDEEAFIGKPILVKVIDYDENKDDTVIDDLFVSVENPRTNEVKDIKLNETGPDSGVFEGVFKTTQNEVSENSDELSAIADDVLTVIYEDKFNSDGGVTILEEEVVIIGGFDGEIEVTTPNEIGNAMIVTVRDRDLNVSTGADKVVVVVTNERTKESIEVLLTEQVKQSRERTKAVATNPSNPFVGMVYGVNDMVGFGKGSELETFSGDYLVASYVDELNSQGQSETLTAKGLFLGADAIVLDKNALEDSAVVGGLVPYTVEVENVSPNDLTNVSIIDTLPAGFRLAKDFVYIGDDKEPVSANGGVMTVTLDEIDSNETIVLTYVLKVSSGVVEGAYENKVLPYIGNILVGNESRATVYIQDDPLFNDALVFGKVFSDVNGNGYLDEGEEGIPGVTIAGVDGINVVTDSKGRYSIEGVDGGRMDRGTNYILKVMPETLPEGSKFTTENPRVQRITQGMPSKFNFGVAVPMQGAYTAMVEVRLGEVFFDWDKDNVKDEYKQTLTRIANFIEEQGGGIIIIEGNTDSLGTDEYNEDLALRRASAVYKVLKEYLNDEVYQNIEVKIIK